MALLRASPPTQALLWLLYAIVSCTNVRAEIPLLPVGMAEFPPFKYTHEGEVIGSDTELVREALKRMGYKTDIWVMPWKRVQAMARQGKFAVIYSFTKSEERERDYFFSAPLSTVQDVFFKLKSQDISWDTFADLYPYRMGSSGGYNYAPAFLAALNASAFADKLIVTSDQPELQGLEILIRHRVDLFICEISVCQYLIRKADQRLHSIDYINKPVGDIRTFHAGFPKSWPGARHLQKQFDMALEQIVAEGLRKQIFKRYGISSPLEPGT